MMGSLAPERRTSLAGFSNVLMAEKSSACYIPSTLKNYITMGKFFSAEPTFCGMTGMMYYLPAVGGWGVVGFGAGFVLRKIGKFLLVLAGIYVATLLYLNQKGIIIITTNVDSFTRNMVSLLATRITALWTATAVSVPVLGAFTLGAVLGFRRK